MSLKALIVAVALGVLAWPSAGHAEKAKTNQITKLFVRAGEQSPVILKVKAGQVMTILAKDGRWIKVRVSGRTGWVPRTKVDMEEEDLVARNSRRRPFVDGRSTKRGPGGEAGPDDRVGADAVGEGADPNPTPGEKPTPDGTEPKGDGGDKPGPKGDGGDKPGPKGDGGDKPDPRGDESKDGSRPVAHVAKALVARSEPNPTSEAAFTAQPKSPLYVVEEKGKWMFVENEEGDAGYLLTANLEIERAAGPSGPDDAMDGPRRRMLDFHGRVGGAMIQQALKSSATAEAPDTYTASSATITFAVGASALYPVGNRGLVGLQLGYDYNKAVAGVPYMGTKTSFSYHILNARFAFGYESARPSGLTLLARLGLHYDAFQVANFADFTKNTLQLPNQNIIAPTIGAALVLPRLTRRVSFSLGVDAIVALAKLEQTKNLEDGTKPDAKAIYVGVGLGYHWKTRTGIQLTYDLGYTAVSFGGPPPTTSKRMHKMADKMSGSDLNNILSLGLLYAF